MKNHNSQITPKISHRAANTPPSPIRKLSPLARQAKLSGKKVYHLNIGQPDIKSPAEYYAGVRGFDQQVLAYEDSQGNESLCKAWSHYVERTLGVAIPGENFLITSGASEGLIFTFMVCCDPGDEVVIFDPTYANYLGFAAIAGVDLVSVPCDIEANFDLPARHAIVERLTPRTKAILVCNPNNPTGTVYSAAQLRILIEICNEHNLFLIVDETYREFVYDGLKPTSVLALDPTNPRLVVLDSLSKRFSLCGARIGALLTCDERVKTASLNLAQARLCAPTIEQFAAARMLDLISTDFIEQARSEYEARRDTLVRCLQSIPGIFVQKPKGAFYCIVGLPVEDAEVFAAFMLRDFSHNQETVFLAPAAGFYLQPGLGVNKVRIAYVLNSADIERAVELLRLGLDKFSSP